MEKALGRGEAGQPAPCQGDDWPPGSNVLGFRGDLIFLKSTCFPGEPGPGDAGAGEYIGELASWRFDFEMLIFLWLC